MHPTRTAIIMFNNKEVGYIGEIHPKYAKEHDLKDVLIAEVALKELLSLEIPTKIYAPISKVPSVERDIALTFKRDVLADNIINTIKSVDKKLLSDVVIFDIYQGEKVASDEKSVAIKLVFTSYETLTDEIINNKVAKVLKQLEKEYGAILRQ